MRNKKFCGGNAKTTGKTTAPPQATEGPIYLKLQKYLFVRNTKLHMKKKATVEGSSPKDQKDCGEYV